MAGRGRHGGFFTGMFVGQAVRLAAAAGNLPPLVFDRDDILGLYLAGSAVYNVQRA